MVPFIEDICTEVGLVLGPHALRRRWPAPLDTAMTLAVAITYPLRTGAGDVERQVE